MNDYLSFRGRISRSEFLTRYWLPLAAIEAVAMVLDRCTGGYFFAAAILCLCWPAWAGVAKRLHDRDRSGWFQLISLIPLIGWGWLLVETWFIKGTPGPNRFGADPLGQA